MKLFEHLLKQILQDNHITEWNRAVPHSNDGILYTTYKLTQFYSPFINSITKPCHRYSFLKFVTANHNLGLPVVRGKWFQPKTCNERSCSTYEVLGDEYHFFLQCTKHQDLQLKFIARCYSKRPSMHKFVELMSSLRKVVIIKLAAFVHIELERENV